MHSLLSRANNISAFLFTVLGAATFAVFLQTFFLNYSVPVDISISDVRIKQVRDYAAVNGRSDWSTLHFDLKADLTPIVNWNVKYLYVFFVAKYQTKDRVLNEITLWDKYYRRFGNNVIKEKQNEPFYHFADDGTNLLGQNVTFVLRWTVVPNAGYMRNVNGGGEIVVQMPKNYNS